MDDVRMAQAGPARQPLDLGRAPGTTDDEVLRGYLELVRTWRGRSTSTMRFRHDDLVVLVGILGTDAKDIERRLIAITGCTRSTAKRFRRLLFVSLAALPVGLTGLVVTAPTLGEPAASAEYGYPGPSATTTAAAPGSVVAATASAPVLTNVDAAAVTKAAPVVAPTTTTAPPPPPAPAATPIVEPGAEAHVSIPDLGIELPVIGGGQAVIDDGDVAHYSAEGWLAPIPAGDAGTYWLAAHQSTHGGPFAALPEIAVGDEVSVTTPTATFTYTVTSMEVVERDAGFGPVYGPDPSARVILLQTCLDSTRRLLVHGTLTATS